MIRTYSSTACCVLILIASGCSQLVDPKTGTADPAEQVPDRPPEPDKPTALLSVPRISTVAGNLDVPISLPLSTLRIESIVNSADVNESGGFTDLEIVREGGSQLLFVTNQNDTAIGVSYVSSSNHGASFTITSASLALGLIKLNPYLWYLTQDDEQAIMDDATRHPLFDVLVSRIDAALRDGPALALDYDTNRDIYTDAMRIGLETVASASFTSSGSKSASDARWASLASSFGSEKIGDTNRPHLANAHGRQITTINPGFVFFGVGVEHYLEEDLFVGGRLMDLAYVIEGRGGAHSLVACVHGSEFNHPNCPLSLPLVGQSSVIVSTPPKEMQFGVGYGILKVTFYKGYNTDIDGWYDPTTAAGKATWANTLGLIGVVVNLVGMVPGLSAITTPAALALSDPVVAGALSVDVDIEPLVTELDAALKGKAVGVARKKLILEAIEEQWRTVKVILYRSARSTINNPKVLKKIARLLPGVGEVLAAIDVLNEDVPFVVDLVLQQELVPYELRHRPTGRVRPQLLMEVVIEDLRGPEAQVTARTVETGVEFDASVTTDDFDHVDDLQFRWDFDGRFTQTDDWDVPWSSDSKIVQRCDREPFPVELEVRDLDGMSGSTTFTIHPEPPEASFSIVEEVDNGDGTIFVRVDASDSSDNCATLDDLEFAWDFDGNFDVPSNDFDWPFSSYTGRTHTYESPGMHRIHLWVRDSTGATDYTFRETAAAMASPLWGAVGTVNPDYPNHSGTIGYYSAVNIGMMHPGSYGSALEPEVYRQCKSSNPSSNPVDDCMIFYAFSSSLSGLSRAELAAKAYGRHGEPYGTSRCGALVGRHRSYFVFGSGPTEAAAIAAATDYCADATFSEECNVLVAACNDR